MTGVIAVIDMLGTTVTQLREEKDLLQAQLDAAQQALARMAAAESKSGVVAEHMEVEE